MSSFLRPVINLINTYDLGDPRSAPKFPGLLTLSPRHFYRGKGEEQHMAIFPVLFLGFDFLA